MPELDGTDIIEPFRKHADTPVILISAYLDDAEVEQLKQVGYNGLGISDRGTRWICR